MLVTETTMLSFDIPAGVPGDPLHAVVIWSTLLGDTP